MSKTDIVTGLQIMLSLDWYLTYIYNTIFFLNNKKKKPKKYKKYKNQNTHWIILINNVRVHRALPEIVIMNILLKLKMLAWKIIIGTK